MKNTIPFNSDGRVTVACTSTLTALGIFLYGLRAYSASRRGDKWRKDFIWVSIALAIGIGAIACMIVTIRHGLGHHVNELSYRQIQLCVQGVFAFLIMNLTALSAAKFGIITLILSIQNPSQVNRVRFLWALGIFQGLVNFLCIFLVIFACAPVEHAWNPAGPGNCNIEQVFAKIGVFQGLVSAITDLILGLWPLTMVGALSVSRQQKLVFCVLIGIGIFPGIISMYRGVLTYKIIHSPDIIRSWISLLRWSSIELWLIIILGSISTLRPLFIRVVYGRSAAADGIIEAEGSLWQPTRNSGVAQICTVIHGNAPQEDSDEEALNRVKSNNSMSKLDRPRTRDRQFSHVSQMKGTAIMVENTTSTVVEKVISK
ncbi:hypothetical protein K461DRAFT_144641 [Myriangium duriaei CBS 260.36]|uniref:Rhodopsin domain-containing protein n=1 Tax=Myriangium duriaei CBS 260.36 TaxID=1168546 RepID=A0A9P4MGL1_9PEZI|nr:hypothetical protein K461DRAFT_144641 [Myriangium duriaei CBS 260.36]